MGKHRLEDIVPEIDLIGCSGYDVYKLKRVDECVVKGCISVEAITHVYQVNEEINYKGK